MKTFNKDHITYFDIEYFRERQRDNIHQRLIARFRKWARETGKTRKDIAKILRKEESQISRWLSGPGNLKLDTVSDLLLAMGAELKHEDVSIGTNAEAQLAESEYAAVYYYSEEKVLADDIKTDNVVSISNLVRSSSVRPDSSGPQIKFKHASQ